MNLFDAAKKVAFKVSTAVKELARDIAYIWRKSPREDYNKPGGLYKALPVLSSTKDINRIFGNGPSAHSTPLVTRNPNVLFQSKTSRVSSFDPRFLKFLDALATELDRGIKPDVSADMFSRNGVHTDFKRLRSVSGYLQTPMSYTSVDNASYRAELGLTPGYSARQRAIATEMWKLLAGSVKIAAVNVPKLSTGGMRRFTADPQWKLDYADWLIDAPLFINFERMLGMVDKGDTLGLANAYETVFATYIQKRAQVDSPGKVRWVFDKEYALSGGLKGKPFPTDGKIILENGFYKGKGVEYPEFAAMRARVVHAGPWTINCYLQFIATTTVRAAFANFPNVFHVNTPDEILAVVQGKYVFCSDVTEYDRSMSREAISLPHDILKEFWDERLIKSSYKLFTSPYYSKPLDLKGDSGTWIQDPLDWNSMVFAGNRSGHAFTSMFAKFNKVVESAFIVDMMYPLLGRCKEFLQGKLPVGVVNNGDDEIVWANTRSDLQRFRELRSDLKNGHYVVKEELGQGYSGQILVREHDDLPFYKPMNRIQTPFEKMWCPERGIDSHMRKKYWPIGFNVRIETLTSTELGREAWTIHNSVYKRLMEPHFGGFIQNLADATEAMDLITDGWTGIDRRVMDDPDSLHHKVDPSKVSDKVLGMISSKIPESVVELFVKRYYKGNVL